MSSKVLIVGVGDVGGKIINFLARDPKCPELIVGDFNEDMGLRKVNTALSNAIVGNYFPKITFKKIDLVDVEKTADLIAKEKPDVIINSSVLQTWHVIRALPQEIYAQLSAATLGAWTPCQVALALKLMQAIKKSGIKPKVVNTAFSCEVNPMLASVNLPPDIGIGNVELLQPGCRLLAAKQLGVPATMVQVYLVCHHVWWVYPREAGYKKAPFWMKIMLADQDVTSQFDTEKLLFDSGSSYLPGTDFTSISASSSIKNMYALMDPVGILTHSPGPEGLPGGYPVVISNQGAKVFLPKGITLEKAIKINEESQKFDGIEKIEKGGKVTYAPYTAEILKKMIGFDHPTWQVQDSYELAQEEMAKYKEFAKAHGVKY